MYVVRSSKQFRRMVKKLKKSGNFPRKDLECIIDELASGKTLLEKYRDHNLTGELQGYRECHVKFDLLLLYRIYKNELVLVLIDIGSHADLFGK